MNLSTHFTLSELTKSQDAIRRGIDNTPTGSDINSLILVCENILEPVRKRYGIPFKPSSGYRSIALNEAVGGSKTSQHCFGQAVDFEVPGVSNFELASWIAQNLSFDQLILEFYKQGELNSGWVHCSYVGIGKNRKQCKTFDGKQYIGGLIE